MRKVFFLLFRKMKEKFTLHLEHQTLGSIFALSFLYFCFDVAASALWSLHGDTTSQGEREETQKCHICRARHHCYFFFLNVSRHCNTKLTVWFSYSSFYLSPLPLPFRDLWPCVVVIVSLFFSSSVSLSLNGNHITQSIKRIKTDQDPQRGKVEKGMKKKV